MTATITLTAEQLHDIFELHGVEPSNEFTAAAGRDYGHVAAWYLGKQHGYLIVCGNNAVTQYYFADNDDDLAAWLEYDDVEHPYEIVQTANVRGAEAVDEASPDTDGPVYVLETRYWNGATETSSLICDGQTPREFTSYKDAQDYIGEMDNSVYHLAHNESARPSYKIVA